MTLVGGDAVRERRRRERCDSGECLMPVSPV